MFRVLIGSVAGGVAMFIVGFLFWATPLDRLAYASTDDRQGAAVQLALAQNLPHTGRYIVPNPGTPQGTILYGRGPVATVDYNTSGFAADGPTMIGGFVHEVVVSLLLGLSLLVVADRVVDFASRTRLMVGMATAATLLLTFSDPIWMHSDWGYWLYAFVADLAMLVAAGLVIVRWFMPRATAG